MNYHCEKLCLITFAVMALHCWCFSTVQTKKTPEQLVFPRVTCSDRRIRAVFGPRVKHNIHVTDMTGTIIPVPQSEGSCGVRLGREKNQGISFYSRYDSCYAQIEGSKVVVPLHIQLTGEDRWFKVNLSCPLIKRHSERTNPTPTPLPGNCDTERALRVDCGKESISGEACNKLRCCYDTDDSTCYYRLNACSLDGHFVFSVKVTDTEQPIDPSSLIVKDQPQCIPLVTTPEMAIFKIGFMDCGAKIKVDGDVVIYEIVVEELHTKSMTNRSPFSLQVQCKYEASDSNRAAVMQSSFAFINPPPVVALGTIGVQMRIAKDASFTSFFPEDHLPLTLPLRKAAYVEISIAQPSLDPTLFLRVRDCFAYPASRHSVWTLLYDGCPNPLDNMRSSIPVIYQGKTTPHSQVRRFDVKTFAFLDPHTGEPSVEEMYFHCWVEICTDDVDCAQRCAINSSEGERQRREAKSNQVPLVSLGPLLLGQNSTELEDSPVLLLGQNSTGLEDSPCVKQKTMLQVTVYVLGGVGAALILILMVTVCSCIRKRQTAEAQPVCEKQVDCEQSQ